MDMQLENLYPSTSFINSDFKKYYENRLIIYI